MTTVAADAPSSMTVTVQELAGRTPRPLKSLCACSGSHRATWCTKPCLR